MGLSTSIIPILIVLPIIPAFGIVFLVSIIRFVIYNKHLNESGYNTKAQIVHKYERGSKEYYKSDAGKSYFIVCEFIIIDNKTNKSMLCKSKFMVNSGEYSSYFAGNYVDLIYLPNDYRKYHNLTFLNKTLIKTSTITFRIFIALIIILIIPIIISILTNKWQLFIFPIIISILYYLIGYCSFICFCSNKTWFKNKSFKSREATKNDLKRFDNINDTKDTVNISKKDKKIKTDEKQISLLSDESNHNTPKINTIESTK